MKDNVMEMAFYRVFLKKGNRSSRSAISQIHIHILNLKQ